MSFFERKPCDHEWVADSAGYGNECKHCNFSPSTEREQAKSMGSSGSSSTRSSSGLIEAPKTLWDGFTFFYSAFFLAGIAATALYMLNVSVGSIPRWVLVSTVTILAVTGLLGIRVKSYQGLITGIAAVSLTLVINFISLFGDAEVAVPPFQFLPKLVVYMPLVGAFLGLLRAFVSDSGGLKPVRHEGGL